MHYYTHISLQLGDTVLIELPGHQVTENAQKGITGFSKRRKKKQVDCFVLLEITLLDLEGMVFIKQSCVLCEWQNGGPLYGTH